MLHCHYQAHHLHKSQLVLRTCACPLLIPSSCVLIFHKSPTYCPRQISSSSLIYSMWEISMKVNPTFIFILIIATSLAIHLSTHILLSHWLWGVLNWGSYHNPHTFSKVSPLVFMRQSDPRLISSPSHLPSEVSLPVVIGQSELGLILWPSHLL